MVKLGEGSSGQSFQVIRNSEVWKTILLVAESVALFILLFLTDKQEQRSFVWLFGFGIASVVIIGMFFLERGKRIDIYKIKDRLIALEQDEGTPIDADSDKGFECWPVTNSVLLFSFPRIPKTIYYDVARGILGRTPKGIDVIVKAIEDSKLSSAAISKSSGDDAMRRELERRGMKLNVPGEEQEDEE